MLWLGLHFPRLPLEVVTAGRDVAAETRATADGGRAVPEVVVEDGRVVLQNEAAAAAGIALGSRLATAHGIAAGLEHHRRQPEREQARLTLLAEALYGFSARVSLASPAAGDTAAGVVLEIGGSLRLFGEAPELARRAETLCRDMGHESRARWAATPLAALILARAGAESLQDVALRHAAVEAERLSAERIERLANMGIHTLGQLLALPRRGLARRFGADLVDYLARLTGERPDPRPGIRPPERFCATLHLLEPLNSKEALAFPMSRLLTDLQHWLVARQLGAERLRFRFVGSGHGQPLELPVRFARAQQSRDAFLGITRLQLTEAELPEDVMSIALEARRLTPWSGAGRGLFHHLPGMQAPGADDEQGDLVDQLRARLGRHACYSLEVRDQHVPEQAWAPQAPLTGQRRRQAGQPDLASPRERPLWLFDPPRPVAAEQLTLLRGPERLHTGWWLGDGPAEARDYYVARHRSGAECWVYVDPRQRWFLHGYFS